MTSLHRRVHFKGGQAISLNVGAMKIETTDFNQEFFETQNKMSGLDPSQMSMGTKLFKHILHGMTAAEIEDERLNKLQIMRE